MRIKKESNYLKKSARVGLIVGVIIAIISIITLIFEFGPGMWLLWPFIRSAFLFQKMFPCTDAPCALIIIPFCAIIVVISATILGLLIGFVISKAKNLK